MNTASIVYAQSINPFFRINGKPQFSTRRELHINGAYTLPLPAEYGEDDVIQAQIDMALSGEYQPGKLSQYIWQHIQPECLDEYAHAG